MTRAHPGNDDMVAECADGRDVSRYRMIREEPAHHRAEPAFRLVKRSMHSLAELVLDRPEPGLHAFAHRLVSELEGAAPRRPADMREVEEVERLRLAIATPAASACSMSAELDQARLFWMQRECKLRQSPPQIGEEAFGVTPRVQCTTCLCWKPATVSYAERSTMTPLLASFAPHRQDYRLSRLDMFA